MFVEEGMPSIASRLYSWWFWTFLFLTGALASTVVLKVGSIQYLEFVYAVQILLLMGIFQRQGLRVRMFRPYLTVASLYAVFMLVAFLLALFASRNRFYLTSDMSLLATPVWITISREIQLLVDVGVMLYLLHVFRANQAPLVFLMKVFFWTGVCSSVFSMISWPLNAAGFSLYGTYLGNTRMRGFYNEGGANAPYLLAVIFVGIILYRLGWSKPKNLYWASFPIVVAFIGSRSKASFFAVLLFVLINIVVAKGAVQRLVILGTLTLFIVAMSPLLDLPAQYAAYQRGNRSYERLSHFRYRDGNFVAGRIAGSFIVPRMIAAHPLAGVGWGNYGIVRDDPQYRGAAAWSMGPDAPGLGFIGESAELGAPLSVYLFVCLLFPYFYLRRTGAPSYAQNLALVQPIVTIFGAQLNLTYPWIATAIALGVAYHHRRSPLHNPPAPSAVLDA